MSRLHHSLGERLRELEKRSPAVRQAARKYDETVKEILRKGRMRDMAKNGKKDADRELLERYAEKVLAQRKLRAKHAAIFSELDALQKEADKIEKTFKESVRARSVPGETVTVYDDELARVTVSGPVAALSYDVSIARRAWPPAVLDAVLVLDDKRCRALVEGGMLDAGLAEEAELPEVLLTPSVKIEIRAGGK